jgi:hypothetical protein
MIPSIVSVGHPGKGVAIGLGADGRGLGLVLLGAVFLGNLPESISSTVGMRQEGRSRTYILAAWGIVAVACTLASVLGYTLLGVRERGSARRPRHCGRLCLCLRAVSPCHVALLDDASSGEQP